MERNGDAGAHGTVLIVDDDLSVLTLMQTLLSAAGYRVVAASAAEDAIRLVRQRHLHLDLAVLDVRMPDISGPQLADELLNLRPSLRVLFMSGFVDDEIIRIKMLDEKGFLQKPFGTEGLLRAVSWALQAMPPAMVASRATAHAGTAR